MRQLSLPTFDYDEENKQVEQYIFCMTPKLRVSFFIKFGKEEHIRDLHENGTIFLNSIEFFRLYEDEYLRGDKFEGTTKITQFPKGSPLTITTENSKKEIKLITKNAQYREFLTNIKGNIFCMHAITPEMVLNNNHFKIDYRNKEFGTHFLVIGETKLFYAKVVNAIRQKGYDFLSGLVEYYDSKQKDGDLTFFHKPSEFSYQNEFRILVKRNSKKPFKLHIGSMEKYSKIFESSEMDTFEIRVE